MDKLQFLKKMRQAGDGVINYTSPVSKKSKYIVATTELDASKYISQRPRPRVPEDKVLVFCWDTDNFKQVDPKDVIYIEPLSGLLGNPDKHGQRRNR